MKKVKVSRAPYIFCRIIKQSKTIAHEMGEGIGIVINRAQVKRSYPAF
jgi:hypothetical protein